MNALMQLLENRILWTAIFGWFMAQLLKVVVEGIQERHLDFSKFFASGGMPSSHSAFVSALTVGMGQCYGYNSPYFTISAVFSFVVMYDAANVRLQAGKQAAAINYIMKILENRTLTPEERLKEILGHTPLQVLMGSLLGIVMALLSFLR